MKKVEDYMTEVRRALKNAHRYNRALEPQVASLAGALRTLALANAEIDTLEVTTVMERTRYGEKHAPHPAFKVQRDAQDSVTRQLKALGLTVADLAGQDDNDPLVDLTEKVYNATRGK